MRSRSFMAPSTAAFVSTCGGARGGTAAFGLTVARGGSTGGGVERVIAATAIAVNTIKDPRTRASRRRITQV
jgi:hypothetical protein